MQIYINDLVSFDQAITTADFISLHIPLTPTTNKVFNDTTFFARGGVIDEDALVKTLDSEIVAQAALDVFSEKPPANDINTKEAEEGVPTDIAEHLLQQVIKIEESLLKNLPLGATEHVLDLFWQTQVSTCWDNVLLFLGLRNVQDLLDSMNQFPLEKVGLAYET
ncbi:hypothetical protein P8452_56425 [Trifolium repens]|nr:hypothetical protein P8452_56425 [Trifolium repens]